MWLCVLVVLLRAQSICVAVCSGCIAESPAYLCWLCVLVVLLRAQSICVAVCSDCIAESPEYLCGCVFWLYF